MTLEGVGALVTGGGTGIGLGCARRLADDGATVTICGRREDVLQAAVGEIGHGARFIACDVTSEDAVREAVAFAADGAPGGLGVVVASAGGTTAFGPLVLTDLVAWQDTVTLNLTGTFLTIKQAAPVLARRGGGSIVAISSIAGLLTHRDLGAYAVTKAGVDMLVRNAADELGRYGIRVNAVRPGLVPTDTSAVLHQTDAVREDYLAQMPLARLGTVEDVAGAVRFLAGDDAAWVTGQVFGVDGGHSLRRGPDLSGASGGFFEGPLADFMGI
jgi:NAD(P)-dependent dehydrogenase (short-subunit alcohol dehydrogenase family)